MIETFFKMVYSIILDWELINLKCDYDDFIKQDKYISNRALNVFLDENDVQKQDVIRAVDLHNTNFIKNKLFALEDYFNNMFKGIDDNIKLDDEQRVAILTDEDNTLIVAGAGSGKTTTMIGKVKYLVEILGVSEDDILVISFTNKAVLELKEKLNDDFNLGVKVCTFHKLGFDLLKTLLEKNFSVLSNNKDMIADYFNKTLIKDNEELKKFLYYFTYYFDVPAFSFLYSSLEEYYEHKLSYNYETLRSKLFEEKEILSLKEEVMIADYLYIHGIDYDYQKLYPLNKKSAYIPDFTIYHNGEPYYIEYYNISESGYAPPYNMIKHFFYRLAIKKHQKIHQKNKTNLIPLYCNYNDNKDLLVHLEEWLSFYNIPLYKKEAQEYYNLLTKGKMEKHYNKFLNFVATFLNDFKTKGYTVEAFENFKLYHQEDKRIILFLDLMGKVYEDYNCRLEEENLVDYADMINVAIAKLCLLKEGDLASQYKYIIIDEYQDISEERFKLIKELLRINNSKLVAVGDDWQAIFAFAGSDVSLFTNFKIIMGNGQELKITNTYRNSQELIDIAGSFVMKNKKQIVKKLTSRKRLKYPLIIYGYKNKDMMGARVADCLREIVIDYGIDSRVLIVGRYKFDKNVIFANKLFKEGVGDKLISLEFPKLDITYLTAHSAKGLGFDNVIIINGYKGVYGFPSEIKNDPIMEMIGTKDREFEFSEERRLFYVALTRTKNRVYIVAPFNKPSVFLKELSKHPNVFVRDKDLFADKKARCPLCYSPLVKCDHAPIFNLYVCSNDKELCDFKTNNLTLKKKIKKCPKCDDGFLIIKQNKETGEYFYGCTNYKKGCFNVEKI